MIKALMVSLVLITSTVSMAKGDRAAKDAELKSACAAEISVAGCGNKDLGKGLLKCLQAYKKEHKDMVISESCKNLRKEFRDERKTKKSEAKPAATK